MNKPNWKNRTLFHGDNLDFLRSMNSGTVDLIYLDPPFNKGKDFHATPDSVSAGASFQDRWTWKNDVHQEWVDDITDDHPKVINVIQGACGSYGDDMGAYLCFMAVRLLAMHRVLKDAGSIYLHCDPTASHYLKQLMDAVFGKNNFINDVTWKRYAVHSLSTKGFDTITDHLLFYVKDLSCAKFNKQFGGIDESKFTYTEEKTERKFQHVALEQSSNKSSKGEVRVIDGKKVTTELGWRWTQETFDKRIKENPNLIYWTKSGRPRYKSYLDAYEGSPVGNLWTDIPYLSANDGENTGYPTQKPVALLERIIKASSNKGDVVLDPFCGCATACIAAEKLGRQWVGIDIWNDAYKTTVNRLKKECWLTESGEVQSTTFVEGELTYTTELLERTDAGETETEYMKTPEGFLEPRVPRMSREEMKNRLLAQAGIKCQGCNRVFDDDRYLELDHNTPKSDGGINHISNRILLCSPCNRLKSNTLTLSGLRKENKKRGYLR